MTTLNVLPAPRYDVDGTAALRAPVVAPGSDHDGPRGGRPHLTLVVAPQTRASLWRRRVGAVAVLLVLMLGLVAGIDRIGASADLQDRVAGHVVVEPGQTLWDVAVSSAPDGVDPRAQLAAIKELNGLRAADVDGWTVVLLPAH